MSIKNLRKIASKGICERGNGCPDTVAVMASRRRNIMEMFRCVEILWQLYGLPIPIEENIMSITAPLAISNTAVSPGAENKHIFIICKNFYLYRKCSHLQWDFIARLAKEPRILLFTVDRGPWKWIFFYIYLHFVAEKERCSVQIHQRGRSEMGSVWYLAKVQAPHYSTQLFRVGLKILWGKKFWEKKSSCTLESTAILLLMKKTALWKHQLCSAETNLLEIDTCSFSKSKWQEAQGYLYIYLNGFSEPGLVLNEHLKRKTIRS